MTVFWFAATAPVWIRVIGLEASKARGLILLGFVCELVCMSLRLKALVREFFFELICLWSRPAFQREIAGMGFAGGAMFASSWVGLNENLPRVAMGVETPGADSLSTNGLRGLTIS